MCVLLSSRHTSKHLQVLPELFNTIFKALPSLKNHFQLHWYFLKLFQLRPFQTFLSFFQTCLYLSTRVTTRPVLPGYILWSCIKELSLLNFSKSVIYPDFHSFTSKSRFPDILTMVTAFMKFYSFLSEILKPDNSQQPSNLWSTSNTFKYQT